MNSDTKKLVYNLFSLVVSVLFCVMEGLLLLPDELKERFDLLVPLSLPLILVIAVLYTFLSRFHLHYTAQDAATSPRIKVIYTANKFFFALVWCLLLGRLVMAR